MATKAAEAKDNWSATLYNKNAAFVYSKQFTSAIVSLLDAKHGEKILDFGCGTGEIAKELEHVVGSDGTVVGIDSSYNLVEKSHQNGFKYAYVGDIQELVYPPEMAGLEGTFDAVFTNAVLHWCKRNPAGVIQSAKKALKKDGTGRFVGEFGGFLNVIGLRSVLHMVLESKGLDANKLDPWFFPSMDEYKALLEKGGFQVTHISLNPRITDLPGSLVDWMRTFCRDSMLADLSDAEADVIMRAVEDKCAIDMRDASGKWSVMYNRLRFVAVLPTM